MNKLFLTLFIVVVVTVASHAQLDKNEEKLVEYVDAHNDEGLDLLKKIININSGTMNLQGVREVGQVLMPLFEELGMQVRWADGSTFNRAGHLVAKIEGGKGKKLLLIGHLDTVFEPDSPAQEWEQIDENTIKGPGIADMKGGDVIILQALRALNSRGLLEKMNITVVMTGDEELSGSPLSESKKELIEAAKWADIALGFENGDGNPLTANVARRSSSGWTLTTTGNAAHSSQIFKPSVGSGAIFEASRILYQFHEELSEEEFLTFNPGMFAGGTTVQYSEADNASSAYGKDNVVSKEVTVTGDIRCLSPEQLAKAQETMTVIVSRNLPGTTAKIEFSEGYPPFAPTDGNYKLLEQLSKVSTDLGFDPVKPVNPSDAGAADISFTAEYIEMGLDGLGMGGADDHTIHETGHLHTFPMQSKRAAVLIYRLTR